VKGHEEHGGSTEMYVNKTTLIMLVWDNKEMSVLGKFCNLGKHKNWIKCSLETMWEHQPSTKLF